MSDHYPPGVTGREPEIAGYPERTEKVECRNVGTAHFRHELKEMAVTSTLGQALDEVYSVEIDCEWEGEVEGWPNGDDFEWTCPRCGNEQVEEGLYEPDPDEQRDW